jgi:carbon starvation protein
VRDPLGGINSLWPLFGIANQMLAAIALCLAVTIILKMQLAADDSKVQSPSASARATAQSTGGRPALALVALVPLLWLLAVTMTAGVQKIGHPDPRIGFLAQAKVQSKNVEAASTALNTSDEVAREKASKDFKTAIRLYANNIIDAIVAGTFLFLVTAIFLLSLREWILLLARKKAADLRETPPVWLPDYALAASKPLNAGALLALAFALVRELSGQAEVDRAREQACVQKHNDAQIYVQTTEQRFNGVKRCC